jgi:uncharacterized repeat protein (TIGR03803 family)
MGAWFLAASGVALNVGAQVVTNLHTFTGAADDGDRPFAALIQASDGYFYGTTEYGAGGVGTVFRITADGTYTNLFSFASGAFGVNGWQPLGGLVQGSDGNFYGTTSMKGTNGCSCGTVFRISSSGSYATIYYFGNNLNDGTYPRGSMLKGPDGNFYGTTTSGGVYGGGVVFRITPSGAYTNLYSFRVSGGDGWQPVDGLAQATDGNFYGTTLKGGSNSFGTVFRISPNGAYTNLHSFAGGAAYGNNDGRSPIGAVVQGPDGNFYGTTSGGGTNINSTGVVFRMTPGGVCTTLYTFRDSPDGANPQTRLVLGSDGNFYGTTVGGGVSNVNANGTLFRISPSGQYTNFYSFGAPGSGGPQGALVQGSDGNFYGTTYLDGTLAGTVFKVFAQLPSPANRISRIGFVGTNLTLTVPSVAGETYRLQYATDLVSGNWSNVPEAAVTNSIGGPLTVTNLGGATAPRRYYRLAITP